MKYGIIVIMVVLASSIVAATDTFRFSGNFFSEQELCLKADVVPNGKVNSQDINFVRDCIGATKPKCVKADMIPLLSPDGIVNAFDLLFVRGRLGCEN